MSNDMVQMYGAPMPPEDWEPTCAVCGGAHATVECPVRLVPMPPIVHPLLAPGTTTGTSTNLPSRADDIAAFETVARALQSLEPEKQKRILRAVAILFGHEAP